MSIAPQRQAVSLHTHNGIQLYQYQPENTTSLQWGRTLRDVSKATITLPPDDHLDDLQIVPGLHWASVWDVEGDRLLWTGPIQQPTLDRSGLTLVAADVGSLCARTRVPITKRWEATDPAVIAAELWDGVIANHNLNVEPIVRPDPEGEPFDFSVTADTEYVSDVISRLVGLGLRWTVVSGTPILGPAGKKPVAALSNDHFLGDGLQLRRDITSSANDILLRSGDSKVYGRVPMAGLNYQAIVQVDDIFGAGNAERATYEYAKHHAAIHDSITLPGSTQLHPDAPIRIEELIPSARWSIEAFGQLWLMELDDVSVSLGDAAGTSVSMEQVVTLPELDKLMTSTSTGGAQ